LERLLKEAADNESQMRTQEEELRQNMEELQATQEEANRKSIEMERLLRESEEKERLLREKEDELQMNMEELVATQEEASRKERIRMEELEKQKSEMTGLLKAIDKTLAVLEYDFNGNILHVNEILCNLSGYSSDELVGKHYSLFFDNKDINNSELYKKFWENMRSGKCFDGIIKCVAKDGNPFLIKGICNPIFDLNGNPVKVMEMAFEISGDSIN
ncbi:MAG: PAS domain-containing protein, partial [Bacteroidota bacterium]|nr:PAS domain-containing protein [Bacteroidota bacterium]